MKSDVVFVLRRNLENKHATGGTREQRVSLKHLKYLFKFLKFFYDCVNIVYLLYVPVSKFYFPHQRFKNEMGITKVACSM